MRGGAGGGGGGGGWGVGGGRLSVCMCVCVEGGTGWCGAAVYFRGENNLNRHADVATEQLVNHLQPSAAYDAGITVLFNEFLETNHHRLRVEWRLVTQVSNKILKSQVVPLDEERKKKKKKKKEGKMGQQIHRHPEHLGRTNGDEGHHVHFPGKRPVTGAGV